MTKQEMEEVFLRMSRCLIHQDAEANCWHGHVHVGEHVITAGWCYPEDCYNESFTKTCNEKDALFMGCYGRHGKLHVWCETLLVAQGEKHE